MFLTNGKLFLKKINLPLHKKSPYSELFWSAFFPDFPAFGLNTERYTTYSVPMRENPGKMLTRITPNTDSFYAVYATFITGKKANLRRHHTIAATAISSHSHIRRKQSQIIFLRCSCSVTLIKIVKKYL